jgi:hypothetical protein
MRKTAGERNACAFKEGQRSLGDAFRAGNPNIFTEHHYNPSRRLSRVRPQDLSYRLSCLTGQKSDSGINSQMLN